MHNYTKKKKASNLLCNQTTRKNIMLGLFFFKLQKVKTKKYVEIQSCKKLHAIEATLQMRESILLRRKKVDVKPLIQIAKMIQTVVFRFKLLSSNKTKKLFFRMRDSQR